MSKYHTLRKLRTNVAKMNQSLKIWSVKKNKTEKQLQILFLQRCELNSRKRSAGPRKLKIRRGDHRLPTKY